MPRIRQAVSVRQRKSEQTGEWLAHPPPIPGEGIEKRIAKKIHPQENGCWYWDDERTGRPIVRWNGDSWGAHRLIYCMFHKLPSLPIGMHVHHHCKNSGCVNPDHLELLTPAQHIEAHRGDHPQCVGVDGVTCLQLGRRKGMCDKHYMKVRRRQQGH